MTITKSVVHVLQEALQTFAQCGSLFVRAVDDERIYLDDQVVSGALEIISKLTARASALAEVEQQAFLLHWKDHGPGLCSRIITTVERRSPPVMHRDDLLGLLEKDEDGAEYRHG